MTKSYRKTHHEVYKQWKDYELEELGESLRREVVLGQEKKHIALKRIERLQERIATENELRPD